MLKDLGKSVFIDNQPVRRTMTSGDTYATSRVCKSSSPSVNNISVVTISVYCEVEISGIESVAVVVSRSCSFNVVLLMGVVRVSVVVTGVVVVGVIVVCGSDVKMNWKIHRVLLNECTI